MEKNLVTLENNYFIKKYELQVINNSRYYKYI